MTKENKNHINIINNSTEFLNGFDPETMINTNYIPEDFQNYVNHYIRNECNYFGQLTSQEGNYDKSSDGHITIKKEKEKVAKNFITLRKQVDKYVKGQGSFKNDLQDMSKGTSEAAYLLNSAVYGNQYDAIHIDRDANINFLVGFGDLTGAGWDDSKRNFVQTGEWNEKMGNVIKLNDMDNNAIIQEPYGAKAFVYKLAEKTKIDKDSGKPFDGNWTYNSTLNNFTQAGPKATIGIAFADLAGDSQTKSFAEMYEEGMKEDYYINPDTGEALPEGLLWMKDPANADVLSKLLSKYVTNIMKDMHSGPMLDEDTGQIKKSTSQLAQDLIKKYSHAGHKHK